MSFIDLFDAALELQGIIDRQEWRACFIGGVAAQRWGQPRVTCNLDLMLPAASGNENAFCCELLKHYGARVPNPAEFALRSRVLLLTSRTGIGIDISLGALPFEQLAVERATPFEFAPGLVLRTCSAEDLLVMKLFASRAIDIRDAEAIAVRNHRSLDWRYVEEQLTPLAQLKEEPEILRTLARIRRLPETL